MITIFQDTIFLPQPSIVFPTLPTDLNQLHLWIRGTVDGLGATPKIYIEFNQDNDSENYESSRFLINHETITHIQETAPFIGTLPGTVFGNENKWGTISVWIPFYRNNVVRTSTIIDNYYAAPLITNQPGGLVWKVQEPITHIKIYTEPGGVFSAQTYIRLQGVE
jgi:hypothetical protein